MKHSKSPLLFLATFLVLIALAPGLAHATKDRGGGNVTADGTLADLELLKHSRELPNPEITDRLQPALELVGAHYPGLAQDLLRLQIHWYVTLKKLEDPGCKLETPIDVQAETVACQYAVAVGVSDVFIAENYWLKASEDQKFDLLIHEWFRALQFKRGISSDLGLFRLTVELKKLLVAVNSDDQSNLDIQINDFRRYLSTYGFGTYMIQGEVARVVTDVRVRLPADQCSVGANLDALDVAATLARISKTGSEDLAELLEKKLKERFGSQPQLSCENILASAREVAKEFRGAPEVLILPRSIRNPH